MKYGVVLVTIVASLSMMPGMARAEVFLCATGTNSSPIDVTAVCDSATHWCACDDDGTVCAAPTCELRLALLLEAARRLAVPQPRTTRVDGSLTADVRPYVMDLNATNGTYLNGERIQPARYYELLEKDVLKFGLSSREYVLLHGESAGAVDDGGDMSQRQLPRMHRGIQDVHADDGKASKQRGGSAKTTEGKNKTQPHKSAQKSAAAGAKGSASSSSSSSSSSGVKRQRAFNEDDDDDWD